jgi:hypothetical protein
MKYLLLPNVSLNKFPNISIKNLSKNQAEMLLCKRNFNKAIEIAAYF